MTPAIPDLRQYLTSAYSDEELATLCFEYFRDVYENFAAGMTKTQKVLLLLDHCQRRDLLPNLAAALERDRTEQYQRRFASAVPTQLRAPDPAPPAVLILTSPIRLELVRIPAGEFLMGSDPAVDKYAQDDEQPQHRVYLPDFYIGKVPVTNAQFEAFVKATRHRTQAEQSGYDGWVLTGTTWGQVKGTDWRHPRGPETGIAQKADHPVVQVSWDDAVAFCRWLRETTGQAFRLPSEAEWEKAARGTQARIYPWGGEPPDANRCNFNENIGDTTPVGRYERGATPDHGVLDMAGNVWEWTGSFRGKGVDRPDFGYPYRPEDGREEQDAPSNVPRVLRGGSWNTVQMGVRCALRIWNDPDFWSVDYSFRVARGSLT